MKTLNEYVLCKTISSIDEYLLSKSNIQKGFSVPHYIVLASGWSFHLLRSQYEKSDKIAGPEIGLVLFILTKEEIMNFDCRKKFTIFEIPDKYADIKELKHDLKYELINISELKEIQLDDLK